MTTRTNLGAVDYVDDLPLPNAWTGNKRVFSAYDNRLYQLVGSSGAREWVRVRSIREVVSDLKRFSEDPEAAAEFAKELEELGIARITFISSNDLAS